MKTKLITLLLVLLIFPVGLKAQRATKKIRVHKVWVSVLDNSQIFKGYLYSVDSTSIKITDKRSMDISNLTTIESKNIDFMNIRRKGAVLKAVGIGTLSGLVVFGIIGELSNGSTFVNGEDILFGAIVGAEIGTEVGIKVAQKKILISIRGDITYFEKVYKKIQCYSLTPDTIQ